jgi:sulfatase modifying factor 1
MDALGSWSEGPARQAAAGDSPPESDMAWIPGGTFLMGSADHYPEEAPVRQVTVGGFWMDRHSVTNHEFDRFVRTTGYVTVAERAPDSAAYPGAKPELLVPASAVFRKPPHRVDLSNPYTWWVYVPGASWRHPQGPGSSIKKRPDHPVVHVGWEDVEAYAAWAGRQLPGEAEWEFAARGGLDGATYAWGEELAPAGRWMANTWQGEFPIENLGQDGFEGTAPVGSFPPNGYGLFDMIGNVWEWTSDRYDAPAGPSHACCSPEPAPDRLPRKVMKGGSHLCAPNYCQRYRPAARMPQSIDTSTSHLGFRTILPGPVDHGVA